MLKITLQSLLVLWLQQVGVLLAVSAIIWLANPLVSYSMLVGGMIYIIPNVYFGLQILRHKSTREARQVLLGFYRGEIGKFILSGVGFAIVFTHISPINLIALFAAYVSLTVMQWLQLALKR